MINVKNKQGHTPFQFATLKNYIQLASLLAEKMSQSKSNS